MCHAFVIFIFYNFGFWIDRFKPSYFFQTPKCGRCCIKGNTQEFINTHKFVTQTPMLDQLTPTFKWLIWIIYTIWKNKSHLFKEHHDFDYMSKLGMAHTLPLLNLLLQNASCPIFVLFDYTKVDFYIECTLICNNIDSKNALWNPWTMTTGAKLEKHSHCTIDTLRPRSSSHF